MFRIKKSFILLLILMAAIANSTTCLAAGLLIDLMIAPTATNGSVDLIAARRGWSTPPSAPTVTLSGGSVLTWSSTNAKSCMASGGWSGAQKTSGKMTLPASSDTNTYTLTCTGPGGTASQSVVIPVRPKTGSQACIVWVPFPDYNNATGANSLDTQSVHDSMVTQMNEKLASLQAQGCEVPPPLNGTDGPWYTNLTPTVIGNLKQAHQYVQGMGTWWEQQSTATGSIVPNTLNGYKLWVSAVTSNGLIPHLALASGGASDPPGVSWDPSNPTAAFNVFKNYAVNMVKAFPQITYWTLMNEIDACPIKDTSCSTDIFGGRATGSAAVSHYQQGQYYAQFLSIVVPAMKAVNPNIKVANAGSGGLDVSPTSFWQGVADAGGMQYLDVFNIHVYGAIQYRVLDQALMYRTWLDHVGKTDMPMIMSEWGDANASTQLATESAAYGDLKKYNLFLFDEIWAWDSTDGYAIAPNGVPNETEQWFMANP